MTDPDVNRTTIDLTVALSTVAGFEIRTVSHPDEKTMIRQLVNRATGVLVTVVVTKPDMPIPQHDLGFEGYTEDEVKHILRTDEGWNEFLKWMRGQTVSQHPELGNLYYVTDVRNFLGSRIITD